MRRDNRAIAVRPDYDHIGDVEYRSPPGQAAVAPYLEKIFSSPEFVRSERMISFLTFIVERALTDQKASISERTVGEYVFHKPSNWDPSLDTIVRSEGRRLRAKLKQYYENLGRNDELKITVPKGTYVPEFEYHRQLTPETMSAAPYISAVNVVPSKTAFSAAAMLIAAIVAACLVFMMVSLARSSNTNSLPRSGFRTAPFTTDFGKEFSPAISPDGRTVAYVWDDGSSKPDIFLRAVDSKTSRRLSSDVEERLFPSWSHDGRQLAYLAVRGDKLAIQVRSLSSGSERTVTSVPKAVGQWTEDSGPLLGCPGPIWSADDQSLFFEDHDAATATSGLVQVGLNGVLQAQITSTKGEFHDLYPRLSPDGKDIAFVRYSSHGVGDLFVKSLVGASPAKQLTEDFKTIQGLAWTHDGKSLIFASNRHGSFQLWSLNVTNNTIDPIPTDTGWASEPSVASDGTWLIYVQASTNWNIWRRIARDAGTDLRLIASSGRNYDARYSPDTKRIAFASDRSGHMELWTADDIGQNPVQLTHLEGSWLGGIAWSPDGASIAFDARPRGHSAVYVISAGGGEPRLLLTDSFEERMPAWSPDGSTLYFNSNRDGTTAIFAYSLKDSSTRLISPPGMFAVQATGSSLIFSNRLGEMFRSNTDGSHFNPLPGHLKASPVMSWAAVSESVYISRADPQTQRVELYRLHDGRVSSMGPLAGNLVPNAPDVNVSQDERWLLYARQENAQSDLAIRRTLR